MLQKLNYWSQTSFLKTIFFNIKYGYLKKKQIILYPKTKLLIDKTAKINLGNGHLVCNYSHYGKRFRNNYCVINLQKNAEIHLEHDNFTLCEGSIIIVRENAKLIIEGKGFINLNTVIDCYSSIKIGTGTIISYNVSICDSDSHSVFVDDVKKEATKGIIIGKNVWIGRNATILKGVTIGDNSIIGACAVVTKNVPNNSLVVGNPAKVIMNNVTWEF